MAIIDHAREAFIKQTPGSAPPGAGRPPNRRGRPAADAVRFPPEPHAPLDYRHGFHYRRLTFRAETEQEIRMAHEDTLGGWGDRGKAAYFLEKADIVVPKRREQLHFLVDFLPWPAKEPLRVLDLGSGYGAVAEEILTRYPHSALTCVDGSEEMVKLARESLAKYRSRVQLRLADLAHSEWQASLDGPFHAIVSGLAIHHLADERKRQLYIELFKLLVPGGVFLNDDIVAAPPMFENRFRAIMHRDIQDQERAIVGISRSVEEIQAEMNERLRITPHHGHIAPLRAQLGWLEEAGFKSVDCFWKYLDLAIFGGVKEEKRAT
jgi:tRNA (cmo5U34)-methyltransferase